MLSLKRAMVFLPIAHKPESTPISGGEDLWPQRGCGGWSRRTVSSRLAWVTWWVQVQLWYRIKPMFPNKTQIEGCSYSLVAEYMPACMEAPPVCEHAHILRVRDRKSTHSHFCQRFFRILLGWFLCSQGSPFIWLSGQRTDLWGCPTCDTHPSGCFPCSHR